MQDGTPGSENDHADDDEHDEGDSPEEPERHECECSSTSKAGSTRKARGWEQDLQLPATGLTAATSFGELITAILNHFMG